MDEQNRYPDDPFQSNPGESGDDTEPTRPFPAYQSANQSPYQTPAAPQGSYGSPGPFDDSGPHHPEASADRPKTRRRTAGILAAALLVGAGAGVGGAAGYEAFLSNDNGTTTGSAGPFEATKTGVVSDGTVEKVATAVLPSVVKINVASQSGAGSGSGIVLSKDGKVLTNNHVVAGAGDNGAISVSFNDGTTKKAKVLGTDPLVDIAVIQVEDVSDLTPAALGASGSLRVGQTVVAVGSPFGLNATVTSGIVSALNRPVSVASEQTPQNPFGQQNPEAPANLSTTYPAIQTDAAINPGNSGGPLVDLSGRVVGINSSIRSTSGGSGGAAGSIGLGFAIPIDEVLPIVNQLSNGEAPTHARLGVTVSNVSGDSLVQGAQLQSVEAGGAAAKADLKTGDVITKVDDQPIDGSESLVATIRGHRPGDKVEITYLRGGKSSTTTAELGSDAQSQTS